MNVRPIDDAYWKITYKTKPEKEMLVDATMELMDYLKILKQQEEELFEGEKDRLGYAEYYMKDYLKHKEARMAVAEKIEDLEEKIHAKPLPKPTCDCGCEDEEE